MSNAAHRRWLAQAVDLALENVRAGGRPFGALLVKDGVVVGAGVNRMMATCDPSSHAEMEALRQAGPALGGVDLSGAVLYASGHPCPMCMAAMRMAGIQDVTYAYSNEDGEPFGLSTAQVYADLAKPRAEQSMKIQHVPARLDGRADLYSHWKRKQ